MGLVVAAGVTAFVMALLTVLGPGFDCHRGTCNWLGEAMIENEGTFVGFAAMLGLAAGGFVAVFIGRRRV